MVYRGLNISLVLQPKIRRTTATKQAYSLTMYLTYTGGYVPADEVPAGRADRSP
jgi:hypothetical protein